MAPTADHPELQGRQRRLARPLDTASSMVPAEALLDDSAQQECTQAHVAVGMNPSSVCYADFDGSLQCAGTLPTKAGIVSYGMTFHDAGRKGVDQILQSSRVGGGDCPNGCAAMCVHQEDGTAWCIGDTGSEADGLFDPDGVGPGVEWARWGARSDLLELATGTWDQLCARASGGTVECTGLLSIGSNGQPSAYLAPVVVGTALNGIWVDDEAHPHLDDPNVFRAPGTRASCVVTTAGLFCRTLNDPGFPGDGAFVFGTAGTVVDGNVAGEWDMTQTVCWLSSAGEVYCREPADPTDPAPDPQAAPQTIRQYFAGRRVVAIAVNPYSSAPPGTIPPSRCAAVDDGSLWCIGENDAGQLGSGLAMPLTTAAEVAPPGSVGIGCH